MTTLVPRGKGGQFVSTKNKALDTAATIKSPLDTFKASGIGNRMRKQYSATFYADPIAKTGDAVSTLSDEYLMKIYDDIRAANPGANDERMWTENGDGNGVGLLIAAMAQAEADPQNQEKEKETSAADISSSDVRSAAHVAATVLSHDALYGDIQGRIVAAERTRRQAPAELAWTLDRLYVERDAAGKVVWNTIEQGTKEGVTPVAPPWPIIGTKEKDKNGNTVNNPDIMNKYIRGAKKATPVSFYGETIRDTPVVKAMTDELDQYLLAAAKVPTGKYADQTSPLYCDATLARNRANEIQNDVDTMVKALKKAIQVFRQIFAVNEMARDGCPPRCVAEFRVAKVWDPAIRDYVTDASKLAGLDEPIIVRDKVTNEYETYKIGEFLAHDTVAAGKKGGTLGDFKASIISKRTPSSGSGQTPEAAKAQRVVLSNAELQNYIAAVATSFETPAAKANFWNTLNGKPEDTDDLLLSTLNIASEIMAGFATQPDLRKRAAELRHTTLSAINELVGLDSVAAASAEMARNKAKVA